jgi:hypothetical protein
LGSEVPRALATLASSGNPGPHDRSERKDFG